MNESRTHEILVHRILSGKFIFSHEGIIYDLYKPSLSLKMEADLLYQTTYQENIYNNFLFSEDIDSLLYELDILYYGYKNDIKRIEKSLETTKVELFKQYFDTIKKQRIKFKIQGLKQDLEDLYNKQHSLDHLTLDHFCDNIKNEYLICHTLYIHDTDQLAFDQDIDSGIFNQVVGHISKHMINLPTYKAIARSDYWKNYWNNNKTNIIDEPVKEWSEEQKSLINISCMYDKVYQHPDCPGDDIIADDDALDGWMIMQKEENEKQKKEKGVDSMLDGKMKNASEVFLMAGNNQQAKDVLGLNSGESLGKMKDKINFVLSSDKPVREGQLPDVKKKIMEQLNKG